MAVDDEQGPWWTRPPEPGPQAPVVSHPQSEPVTEPDTEAGDEPDDGIVTPPAQPWVPQQFGGRPVEPAPEPESPAPEPEQFTTWGTGFAAPPPTADPWEAHPGLFTGPEAPAPGRAPAGAPAGAEPPAESPTETYAEARAEAPTGSPAESRGDSRGEPWDEPQSLRGEPQNAPREPWSEPQNAPREPWSEPPNARREPRDEAAETTAERPAVPEATPTHRAQPKPPKQVIRRVAVVDPNERTETLPALGDDIFAVFDAQGRQGHQGHQGHPAAPAAPFDPYAGGAEDPLSHLRDDPAPHRLHLPQVPHVQMPPPRFLLMAVGSGLVVLLVILVILLFGPDGADPAATATSPTPAASSDTVAAQLTGTPPSGLKKLSDREAGTLLAKAGQGANGRIGEAWTWSDKNGRNLVVTTTEVTGKNRKTLRVIHLADVDGDIRTLRVMKDPNLPECKNASAVGAAGFTKNAMVVRDLNGDGIAEVTAGWTSRCGARTGTSEIKLALISNGDKYIIRDEGVVGKAGAGSADPRSSRWPDGFYPALTKLYKKLYS